MEAKTAFEGETMEKQEGQLAPKTAVLSMDTSFAPTLLLRCKVALMGDACVGKTALAAMFESNLQHYPAKYSMTTATEFSVKRVVLPLPEGTPPVATELYLFDCAGQSIFNQVGTNSKNFENASYVAVVYDVGNRESFQSCGRWLQQIRATRPSSGPPIPGVLVANKVDLRSSETGGLGGRVAVAPEEGRAFAAENGLSYFEASAMQGTGVNEAFNHIATEFYERYEDSLRRAETMIAGGM